MYVLQRIFFRQLTEVNNVEIIGRSFGEVNMPYFTYLKYCISKMQSGNFIITVRKTIMLQKKRLKNWNWT